MTTVPAASGIPGVKAIDIPHNLNFSTFLLSYLDCVDTAMVQTRCT
jgi:hypothetical protein